MKTSNFLRLLLMLPVLVFFSTRINIYYLNAKDKDPLQIISDIGDLLNQTMIEYKSKNYTDASELIDITYINNYEYIEEKLKELDKNLMEKTESLIREDCSNTINNKELLENRNNLYKKIQNNFKMLADQFREN